VKTIIILSFLVVVGLFAQGAKVYEVPASDAEQGRILWGNREQLRKQYEDALRKFEQWRTATGEGLTRKVKVGNNSYLEFTSDFRFATAKESTGWLWPSPSTIGCTSSVDSGGQLRYKCEGPKMTHDDANLIVKAIDGLAFSIIIGFIIQAIFNK
jgi:hypothetical protein